MRFSTAVGRALRRPPHARLLAAEQDFRLGCALLELNERLVAGDVQNSALAKVAEECQAKWQDAKLEKAIPFANDSMTIQLSEMFQHLHDIDSGDSPSGAGAKLRRAASTVDARRSAAFQPSIGPSSHTNPLPTLHFQMKTLYEEQKEEALVALRHQLEARHGFALWVGPSQAATSEHQAGIYVRGTVAPGTVVGLYPGAVFNAEMQQKAEDVGHFGNPDIRRHLVPRFDECLLDTTATGVPRHNPYALAQMVRHPPPGVQANVMRLQYDYVDASGAVDGALPFPQHLRSYVPNVWGAAVSTGQSLYGSLEQQVWCKGMVLVALRPLWNEELFVDMTLNPFAKQAGLLPAWAEGEWAARKELRMLSGRVSWETLRAQAAGKAAAALPAE